MINNKLLDEIQSEVNRFTKKLMDVRDRMAKDNVNDYSYYGTKENGALKRAALDLKNVLTKLNKTEE